MAGPTDETLDALEALAAEKLDGLLESGYFAEQVAKILANFALYRRLGSGSKMRVRPDGSADIAEATR